MLTSAYFIEQLGLVPHIEGGYFKEIYQSAQKSNDQQALSSTIYYLLASDQRSKFHKLLADEIWFYHYGKPLSIYMIDHAGNFTEKVLGLDIAHGELPQVLVPSGTIFGAELLAKSGFTLVSCMVSPAFCEENFTLYTGDELIAQYPQHQKIISKLNPSQASAY